MGLMYRLEVLRTYSEGLLSKITIRKTLEKLEKLVSADIVVVGMDLSGLVASWVLSSTYKIVILPQPIDKESIPLYSSYPSLYGVIEGEALELVRELGVSIYEARISEEEASETFECIYLVDPIEIYIKLLYALIERNAQILPGYVVNDLVTRGNGVDNRVTGVVLVPNSSSDSTHVKLPLYIDSQAVVDNTGRNALLVRMLAKRQPQLKLEVEGSSTTQAWKLEAELSDIVERYAMVRPGLFLSGYSLIETFNLPKADLVLGTQVCIGKKLAHIIKSYVDKLKES